MFDNKYDHSVEDLWRIFDWISDASSAGNVDAQGENTEVRSVSGMTDYVGMQTFSSYQNAKGSGAGESGSSGSLVIDMPDDGKKRRKREAGKPIPDVQDFELMRSKSRSKIRGIWYQLRLGLSFPQIPHKLILSLLESTIPTVSQSFTVFSLVYLPRILACIEKKVFSKK